MQNVSLTLIVPSHSNFFIVQVAQSSFPPNTEEKQGHLLKPNKQKPFDDPQAYPRTIMVSE